MPASVGLQALVFVVLVNTVILNHVYNIGKEVLSALAAMLALFVLWQYLPYIYCVFIREGMLVPMYDPVFNNGSLIYEQVGIKPASQVQDAMYAER